MKAFQFVSAVAGAVLLSTAAMAATGEFGNHCAMNLAQGKKVKTDCQVSGLLGGKTYCFIDADAKTLFFKEPEVNLAKASDFYQEF